MKPTDIFFNVGLQQLYLSTIMIYWDLLKKAALQACDEVCWYKKSRNCNVGTWRQNSGAKDEMQKKKEAYKEMTNNPTEETQNEYRRLKKAAKKTVARAMKEEAVRKINEISRNRNNVFRLARKMWIESIDVFGGRCMRGSDGALYINADRAKLWIAHM